AANCLPVSVKKFSTLKVATRMFDVAFALMFAGLGAALAMREFSNDTTSLPRSGVPWVVLVPGVPRTARSGCKYHLPARDAVVDDRSGQKPRTRACPLAAVTWARTRTEWVASM